MAEVASSNLPSMEDYMSFVNKYHADTVRKGMIYTVPGYDRETGKELSSSEAYERYLPDIEAGRVKGLPAGKAGMDKKTGVHFANLYARKNHKNVKADHSAVSFDFYKPSLSDAPR